MRSTIDALVRMETAMQNFFAQLHHIIAIFDLGIGQNTTWKHGIIIKLCDMDLRGALPSSTQGFRADREFRVQVGNSFSNPEGISWKWSHKGMS